MLETLLLQWTALLGFGSLIAFLINLGKRAGWVRDGDAPKWSLGLNLAGMVLLAVVQVYRPDVDVAGIDAQVAAWVEVLATIAGLVLQLGSAKLTHTIVRGMPVIGVSHTVERGRRASAAGFPF
jgi:hypothetical protein